MWTVCSSFASVNFTLDNYVSSWQQRVVLKLHRPAYRLLCTFLTEPAVGISSRHGHLFSLLKFPKNTNHFEVRGGRTFLPFTHAKSNSVFFDIDYILGHSRNEKRKHLSSDQPYGRLWRFFPDFFKSTSTKGIITNSMLEGRKSQRVAMLNTWSPFHPRGLSIQITLANWQTCRMSKQRREKKKLTNRCMAITTRDI